MNYSSVWASCNDEAFGTSLLSGGPQGGLEVMARSFSDVGPAPGGRNSCAKSEVHLCAEAGFYRAL